MARKYTLREEAFIRADPQFRAFGPRKWADGAGEGAQVWQSSTEIREKAHQHTLPTAAV